MQEYDFDTQIVDDIIKILKFQRKYAAHPTDNLLTFFHPDQLYDLVYKNIDPENK